MIICIQTKDDAGRIQNNYTEDLEEDLKRVEEMGIKIIDWFPCPWKEEGWT